MDGTFWIAMGLVGLPVGMFLWAGTFDWLEVHRMRKGYARSEPAPTLEDTTEHLRALHRKYRREAFEEWDAEFARLSPPAPYTFEPERFPEGATLNAVDGGTIEVRDFSGRVTGRYGEVRDFSGRVVGRYGDTGTDRRMAEMHVPAIERLKAAHSLPPKGGSGVSRPKAGPTISDIQQAHQALQAAQDELRKRNRAIKAREAILRHIAQHGISAENADLAARLPHQIEEER